MIAIRAPAIQARTERRVTGLGRKELLRMDIRNTLRLVVLSIVSISSLNLNLAFASCSDSPPTGCYGNNYYSFNDCDCDGYGCTLPGPPYYQCFQIDCCTWSWSCYPDAPCAVRACHVRDYV